MSGFSRLGNVYRDVKCISVQKNVTKSEKEKKKEKEV